jgi:replicative DNA helicase
VSVSEIGSRNDDFERTPPHDVAAEQCVLGGMLLSKDAISDVIEVIRPQDHYRPAHQVIHEAILDMYGRGEPVDAITVADELAKRGDITRVGDRPYLHTLIATVPTAANAGFYARIVRERAILRRLVEAGTRIVQFGYAGDADADELVDRAQAEVYAVTDRRTTEDYHSLSEIMPGALDEIEAIGSRGGVLTGVPTGFADLDSLTNGLHPGQMIVIAARPAVGKALALDTPLPTPAGWTTMGQVAVGDYLLGADGKPAQVVAATEVMHERPCFEVEFDDGSVIVADAEHLWKTTARAGAWYWPEASRRRLRMACKAALSEADRCVTATEVLSEAGADFRNLLHTAGRSVGLAAARVPVGVAGPVRSYTLHAPAYASRHTLLTAMMRLADQPENAGTTAVHDELMTTAQIAATLRHGAEGRLKHAVALAQPVDLPPADLPLPPYALGVWLGGGDNHSAAQAILRDLGVLGDKHIPASYLRASSAQRRALLVGLLDTGGTINSAGSVHFIVTSRRLATDTRELLLSLGYRCGWSERRVPRKSEASSVAYTITFTPRTRERFITAVRPIASVPVRCVQVANSEHMYLAGRSMIPTHNSTLALDFARAAAIKHGMATVVFSLEMGRNEITMRLLSAEARVPMHTMRTGQMNDDDWARLARRMSEVADAPLFIDDSPNMSLMEIRAKCRRLKQRHNLKFVIIDYLQLMSSPKRVESRQQEVSEMSRSLKLLAKELEVPLIALSQLNRGPEQRTDKKPLLSDLRESGCLTADTTLLRADTGAPVTFDQLMRDGWAGVLVWSLDEQNRMVPAPVTNVFESGTKEVYLLRLASGREVKATANHPFLTFGGWTPLGELVPGARVAIPRHIPEPIAAGLGWTEHRLGLLAHLIGDGCVIRKQPVHYTSTDEENLAFVEAAAAAEFGITPRRVAQKTWWHVYLPAPEHCTHGRGNPVHDWFRELGIEYLHSYEKRLPDALYAASEAEVCVFLRHLWATDGCVWLPRGNAAAKAYYASSSRELAYGVADLLARLGIVARIRQVQKAGRRPGYHVIVADGPSLRTFCARVGVHGRRGETATKLAAVPEERAVNTNVDTIPVEVWNLVQAERVKAGLTERAFQAAIRTNYCGTALYKSCPSRERLMRCAEALASDTLREIASSDVYWDEIVCIEPIGTQPVYDATIKETHNFIANGINVHNSIEQDADVVILLHREDAYEKESPRAGEADLIVAKHRNGPTATVTVAFQGHYSRFVDMAPA